MLSWTPVHFGKLDRYGLDHRKENIVKLYCKLWSLLEPTKMCGPNNEPIDLVLHQVDRHVSTVVADKLTTFES